MTPIEEFIAYRQIETLKYRYLRAGDTQQWDLMADCFSENVVVWYSGGKYRCQGKAEVIAWLRSVLTPGFISSHIAVHPEITLINETSAEGIWRLQDIVHFAEANPGLAHADIQGGEENIGAGYYYDEYVKQGPDWKISSTGYVRIFESFEKHASGSRYRLEIDPARGRRT